MGGKIDGYLDCTSPYSYFAMLHLRKQRSKLAQYGVEVEFHPIFLGGINVGSGNKPPWTLPAKAAYGPYDLKRAIKHFESPMPIKSPPFFPILSILPQRAMLYIKAHYPRHTYETTFLSLWSYSFNPAHYMDISFPPKLRHLLSNTSLGNHYNPLEIDAILAGATSKEYKDLLTAQTKMVVEKMGAFGAPWFWLRNGEGVEEPLFGSDRFAYMWEFLGVGWRDVEILEREDLDREEEGVGGKALAKL